MTEDSYLLDGNDKKKVNWFARLLKIAFILAALVLVIITVLANMGGNSDMLKQAVSQFVSKMFGGRPVQVDRLVNMSFFPSVGLDVEGIHVISKPENGTKIFSVGKMQAYMGFWHVATSRPRLRGLYFEDIKAIRGTFTPNELYIEKVFIDHDIETGTAALKGVGRVGVHPWTFEAGMQVFGSKGKYTYMLANDFPLNVDVADINFKTRIINHEDNYFKLEDFELTQGGKSVGGDITLSPAGAGLLKIKANFQTKDAVSDISADLLADLSNTTNQYSGTVMSEKLVLSEVLGDNSVFTILQRIRDVFGYTRVQEDTNPLGIFGSNDLKLDLQFSNIEMPSGQTQALQIPLHLEKGHLRLAHVLALPIENEIITITQKTESQQNISFLEPYLPIISSNQDQPACLIKRADEELDEITLEAFSYNFVQASLRAKSEQNECSDRVKKIPEPEPEEQQKEPDNAPATSEQQNR